MTITTIKISQLPSAGNVSTNTLLPVVSVNSTNITDKLTVGSLANFILNESGNLLPAAFVSDLTYNVVNASQPNITSVGTLTNLTLSSVSTLNIPGGTNGYVLQTDGTGNLNWTAMAGSGNGAPGGANTQIQFNDEGTFGGDTLFSYDKNSKTLNAENIIGNVIESNTFIASGNVEADYFLGNGSQLTGITISASGSNNSIQYNIDGFLEGSSNLTFDSANSIFATINIVSESVNANVFTANTINANLANSNFITASNAEINHANANTLRIHDQIIINGGGNIYETGNVLIVRTQPTHIFEIWGNDGATDYKWSFNADGHITMPGNTASIRGDIDLIQMFCNNKLQSGLGIFNNTELSAADDVKIFSNNDDIPYLWVFDLSGNLVFPDTTTQNTAWTGSVDTGNVTGLGNIATINLDGNNSNVLMGDGTFSAVSAIPNLAVWTDPPASYNSPGTQGQIAYDAGGNLFVCVATDTWARFSGSLVW